jgi:signal transduction histidine kinase
LIKEELHEKMKNDFDEAFEAINNSGKRLLRTIDLILNMSLIQTGKQRLNIKPVELNFVLKNLVNEFMPMAKKKNLSLNFNLADDEPKVLGDEYTLVQAFQNLIDNAIKYTNNGKIEILLNKMENKICVNIIDTGIGISESYIKNLFEPFSQEDNGYTRKFEGTGLGLALTKKYIELNSGILTVNSKKGEGSIFSVILNKA